MAQQLWTRKKMGILRFSQILHFQGIKATLATHTEIYTLKGDQLHGIGDKHSYSVHSNANFRILCEEGRLKEAFSILRVMDGRGIWPNSSTYVHVLQGCVDSKALPEGKLLHAHMVQQGFALDVFLETKLLIMYAKCGTLVDARQIFDEMPERNVVTWTAIISAYTRRGYCEEALALFAAMRRTCIGPNQFTFASIVPAFGILAALEHGKKIHGDIIRSGFQSDVFVGSALVDMYVACNSMKYACQVFHRMPERNVVSWNSMIAGFVQHGLADLALELFEKMPEQNVVSWTTMIAGYVQKGCVNEALKLFRRMPERDAISWNAMISGYVQNGNFDGVLELFREMQQIGMKSDSDTFASILPACASLAALAHGKEVHEDVIRCGFQSDVFVGTALVDMYAKSGCMDDAHKVFDKMSSRDVVSWNAVIVGYSMHGYGKEALKLFERLQQSGTNPDSVTFLGVLSACCHAGLVDDGWKYFHSMSRDYDIKPAVEHYCCIVDLLGRAGRLNEAHNFITRLPIKPDAAVWGSLLAACRVHSNMELGECAAEQLFQLEPESETPYVLMSNIYAAAGRWDGMLKVRTMMKDRKVSKKPGCSWILVDNKVYAFLVGDC